MPLPQPCSCPLHAGGCPKSYGTNVARLAGLPPAVVLRAAQMSAQRETQAKEQAVAAATAGGATAMEVNATAFGPPVSADAAQVLRRGFASVVAGLRGGQAGKGSAEALGQMRAVAAQALA